MASQAAQPGAGNSAGGGRLAQFKLVLLGESAVGKSSLVNRFVQGHFSGFQEPTYGSSYKMENTVAEYCTQTVVLDDTTVEFEIYHSLARPFGYISSMYYRGAQAAIVVYDITNANTFTMAKSWVDELHREARPDLVIAPAGNKSDLGSRRTVEYEEANAYAEEKGLLFLETSAKDANNVNEIFLAIARKLPREDSGPKAQGISVTGEEGSSSGNKLGQCCNR